MNLEKILTNFMESYLATCYVCMPAIVVGVKDGEEARVDVKMVINRQYKDGSELEYATIPSVPCIQMSTKSSSVTMPVSIGDGVLLMFSQKDMEKFKLGSNTPHTPNTNRWMDMNDAVAFYGLCPFVDSPNKKTNKTLPHNPDDLVLTHNRGTSLESEIRLAGDGSVHINAVGGLFVNGLPYAGHTHPYTDNGIPLVTAPPVGQT